MIKFSNVTKYYGKKKVLDNLSFEIKKNQIFGIVGNNGAGKTTTIKLILNLIKPEIGQITIDGKNNYNFNIDKIGYLLEERSLMLDLSVYEQLKLLLNLMGIYDLKTIKSLINYWFEKMKIDFSLDQIIGKLSKGNQQKIQIIASIIHEPQILILDEPFSGLDPLNVDLLKTIITEYQREDRIIILASHRLDKIEFFCNDILILNDSKIIYWGSLEQLKSTIDYRLVKGKGKINPVSMSKGIIKVKVNGDNFCFLVINFKIAQKLMISLLDQNLSEISIQMLSLQNIYLNLVKGVSYEEII